MERFKVILLYLLKESFQDLGLEGKSLGEEQQLEPVAGT